MRLSDVLISNMDRFNAAVRVRGSKYVTFTSAPTVPAVSVKGPLSCTLCAERCAAGGASSDEPVRLWASCGGAEALLCTPCLPTYKATKLVPGIAAVCMPLTHLPYIDFLARSPHNERALLASVHSGPPNQWRKDMAARLAADQPVQCLRVVEAADGDELTCELEPLEPAQPDDGADADASIADEARAAWAGARGGARGIFVRWCRDGVRLGVLLLRIDALLDALEVCTEGLTAPAV
jgi:hypothetical protein